MLCACMQPTGGVMRSTSCSRSTTRRPSRLSRLRRRHPQGNQPRQPAGRASEGGSAGPKLAGDAGRAAAAGNSRFQPAWASGRRPACLRVRQMARLAGGAAPRRPSQERRQGNAVRCKACMLVWDIIPLAPHGLSCLPLYMVRMPARPRPCSSMPARPRPCSGILHSTPHTAAHPAVKSSAL